MKDGLHDAYSFAASHREFVALATVCVSELPARRVRLKLFLAIVSELPLVESGDGSKRAVDEVLNAVEDRFSGVPYDPGLWATDGRMYPAGEDFRRRSPTDDVACYFHREHASYFGCNGSFRIAKRNGNQPVILVDRPGADGRYIGDLFEQNNTGIRGSSSN